MSNFTLHIEPDLDPPNPRKEFDNLATFVAYRRNYNLGDKHDYPSTDYGSLEEVEHAIRHDHPGCILLPLYLYDHSGLTLSTRPFFCPWDSWQVGFVFITRQDAVDNWGKKRLTKKVINKALDCIRSEVETYSRYLQGDVWGYVVKDKNGNQIESCWGFYGREYAEEEGNAMLACLKKEEEKKNALA